MESRMDSRTDLALREPVPILMVDDRPENLMALEAILSKGEYRLVKAASGNEALKHLLKSEFAMVLLDVMMPEMDGYELATLIRSREATKHLPIIFLTAVATDMLHVFQGYKVGAADYLTKPLDSEFVKSKVAVFAELYRKSRQLLEQEAQLRERERREKEYELALMKSEGERRLSDLVRTIPGVVWEITYRQAFGVSRIPSVFPQMTFVSDHIDKMLGYAVSEEIRDSINWLSLVHPEDRDRFVKHLVDLGVRGGQGVLSFRMLNRIGESVWIESHYIEVRDVRGRITGLRGVGLDVTERVRVTEELTRAKEAAESANRLKSMFLANMSHEIRTPLGAILGFSDLVRDSKSTPAEREQYLDIIARNGQSLSHLINDILDLSKIEANHMNVEFLELDVDELISDVLSSFKVKAHGKKLRFDFHTNITAPEKFVSDPVRFKQILVNLVDNAIKFTSQGGISVHLDYQHETLSIRVTDSGVGVSDEQRDRLFKAFNQADGSTTRKFGGTGLGLALSQRLARLLGGDVALAESELGRGSTFLFTVKNMPGSLSTSEKFAGASSSFPEVNLADPKLLSGTRILLVEDSPDNRHFICRILSRLGAEVDTAENGAVGVVKATESKFDIILMDIQMPILDGYGATRKLREIGCKTPIIALTAHALSEDRKDSLQAGCSEYLAKPVNKGELASCVYKFTR